MNLAEYNFVELTKKTKNEIKTTIKTDLIDEAIKRGLHLPDNEYFLFYKKFIKGAKLVYCKDVDIVKAKEAVHYMKVLNMKPDVTASTKELIGSLIISEYCVV